MLVIALEEDPHLADAEGYVDDSGEGRWTIEKAITHDVPLPVISAAVRAVRLPAGRAARDEGRRRATRPVRRPRRGVRAPELGNGLHPALTAALAGPGSHTT